MTDTPAEAPAHDLVKRLRDDAESHYEVAHCADMRPEETLNWEHGKNCEEAADEITRLTAEVERLRAALEWFVKREKSIMADVLSAHRNRGNGASQWMREDDADFRRDMIRAFETARATLTQEPRT